MKSQLSFLVIFLLVTNTIIGQIKIGDNPQDIHPASVLELESPSRVLVITRVTDVQMNTISPLRGALVYNTDQECLHYYDGNNWINICEVFNNAFTVSTDAVFNPFSRDSTVVITQTDTNYNFEVNQITGDNIVDTSINGAVEIQQGSITGQQLSNATVSFDKLADGGNTGDLLRWNGAQWVLENEGAIDITEKDSIVGNEISDVRPGGALERLGLGTEGSPFIVGVRNGGIDNARLDKVNIPLSGFGAAAANVNMGGFQIFNLLDPTDAQDAANKNYVDNQVLAINTLTDGALYIGDATNTAQERIPSGDARISNTGVIDLETDAVETDEIQDNAITNAKLDDDSVNTLEIVDNAVTNAKLADDAVNTLEIVDDAVTTDKILDGTVGTLDIADNAITNIKMDDDAVGTAEIIDGSVTRPKLEAGSAPGDLMRWDGTNWILVNETALTVTENDGDPGNELQDLNLDPSNVLTLTNPATVGNQVDLSAYVNDDTNELSDLQLTVTTLELTNAALGATGVDLDATFATDAELIASADDDISSASFDNLTNELTINEGASFVTADLTDLDDSAGVTANATAIATNAANITTNTADIATNTADIATNTADIATNTADIATNTADIATNTADIATNTADIATNTADITTNTADIAANTADIATNTTDIVTNTADIATNTADIATNTADIATNTADIATNTADIVTNAADITTNAANITTNTTDIATNTTGLAAHIASDNDLDDENELSDVQLSGTTLELTNAAPGATGTSLASLDETVSAGNGITVTQTGQNFAVAVSNPVVALGRVVGGVLSGNGATLGGAAGSYTITLLSPPAGDYVVQLTLLNTSGTVRTIQVTNQAAGSFDIEIYDATSAIVDSDWYFTVTSF